MKKEINEEGSNKEIIKRLDLIASLLLQLISKDSDKLQLKEKITLLDEIGVRPIDIGKILGRTSTHINKELAVIRRKHK